MLAFAVAASLLVSEETAPSLDRLYSLPRIIGTAPVSPTWSPDSRKLAFLWNDSGYDFRDVFVVDVDAPTPFRLTHLSPTSPPREGDPGVADVVWNPEGVRILFRLGSELFLVSSAGGTPERVAEGSQGRFSPNGRYLAYLRRGDLFLRESDAIERPLVSDPRPEVFVESFEWSLDGQTIAFVEKDESRVPLRGIPDYLAQPEVELVPVRRPYPGEEPASVRLGVVGVGEGARFFDLGGTPVDPIVSYRWSRNGSLLVDTSDLYVKKRRILVVEPGSGTVREIHREEEPENVTAYWQADWAPDGRAIYFLSDRDEDYHVYRLPLEGGAPSRITSGGFAVSQFAVTPIALAVVANSPRPEDRQVFRVGLEGGEPVRVSLENGTHTPFVSPDGRFAASLFSSDGMPPELFLTSLQSDRGGAETRVTRSPLPEFDALSWVSPEYVSFESHVDGATIHGRLQVPAGLDRTKKHPAIVGSIYFNTVRNQWGGRNAHPLWGLERHLLEKGYVLFNIDVRGSWGRGKTFRRGIGKNYGGIDVEDIESGVRYLSRLPFVDSDRIGIWGSSYGGLLTCMSLFTRPELFRAGVAGAPATNVFHATTGEMRVMMAPRDEAAAYEAASAYTRAEGLEDPLLLIHGMRDRTVLYQDSVFLVDRLMRLGKNVDFVSLPDAGHGWDLEELHETRFAFRKLVEFFDLHLKGESNATEE
jgi:dipeptidyl-peptidase-4